MSASNNIGDVLTRVEQMLDALQSPAQSSADFKAGCDSLQAYLNYQAGVFAAAAALSEQDKTRVASVVERLARLQKRLPSYISKIIFHLVLSRTNPVSIWFNIQISIAIG